MLLPAALATDGLLVLIVGLSVGVLVFAREFFRKRLEAPPRLTWKEFVLVSMNAPFWPSILSMLWLAFYWVVYWGAVATGALTGKDIPAATVAQISCIPVVGVMLSWAFLGLQRDDLAESLFSPGDSKRHQKFAELADNRRFFRNALAATTVVVGLSTALLAVFDSASPVAAITSVLIFGVAANLEPLADDAEEGALQEEALNEAAAVFERAGYRVVRFPTVDDAEAAPNMSSMDLLASTEDVAFAVEVLHVDEDQPPPDWRVSAQLSFAARSLTTVDTPEVPAAVFPVLIVDGQVDKTLVAFTREQPLLLLQIDRSLGKVSLTGKPHEALNSFIHEYQEQLRARVDLSMRGVSRGSDR